MYEDVRYTPIRKPDKVEAGCTMNITMKKKITCMIIGISAALCGIEHAVILPSAWGYLQNRFPGIHPVMLGSLLASFNLGALLAGPLSSWWSWKCRNTRALLLTFNLFSLTGAIFYSALLSPWLLVGSRFLSGLGFGCQSIIVVDMCRSLVGEGTSRRAIFLFHLSRQFGLLLGPALYLPLESAQFASTSTDGFFKIDKFSSPGLLLAGAFCVQEFLFLFGYYNLTSLREEERLQDQVSFTYQNFSVADNPTQYSGSSRGRIKRTSSLPHHIWSNVFSPTLELARASARQGTKTKWSYSLYTEDVVDNQMSLDNESDVAIESAEHFIMSASLSQSLPNNYQKNGLSNQSEGRMSQKSENHSLLHVTDRLISESSVCFEPVSRLDRLRAYLQELSDEYVRDDTVVLLAVTFTAVSTQKLMETVIMLFTEEMYMETERLNSFLFILIGFQLFLVALFAQLIRRLVVDRVLLLLGLILLCASLLALLLIMPQLQKDDLSLVPYMVLSGVTCFLSTPLLVLCSSSLLINITAFDKQIMTQELSQVFISLGSILGPLWGSALWGHTYILWAVPFGMVLVIKVLYLLSFRHMVSIGSSGSSSYDEGPILRTNGGTPEENKNILS